MNDSALDQHAHCKAKTLGLSGARAGDPAKIEALRATNVGKLQAQIDKDKKAIRYGLSVSDLSPLTNQEKLRKAMQELERAVAGGDSSAAQAAAQAAPGFGRNLYASGQDYNGLYDQATALIDGVKVGGLDKDSTSMGQLADTIEALPDNFARCVRPGGGQERPGRDHGGGTREQCSARPVGGSTGQDRGS